MSEGDRPQGTPREPSEGEAFTEEAREVARDALARIGREAQASIDRMGKLGGFSGISRMPRIPSYVNPITPEMVETLASARENTPEARATREVRDEVSRVAAVLEESGVQIKLLAELGQASDRNLERLITTIERGQAATERSTRAMNRLTAAGVVLTAVLAAQALWPTAADVLTDLFATLSRR